MKYAGKRDKPARLVELMMRFGLNFLTLEALTTEHLQALRTTSTNHWSRLLRSLPQPTDQDSGSSSEEDETQLAVSWDTRDELQSLPPGGPGSEAHNTAVRRHFNRLVQRFVTRTIVTEAVTVREETGQRRASGSSGYPRRRKQATPRRTAAGTSREPSNPAGEAQGTPPAPGAAAAAAVPAPDARRDPREVLLALPGIKATKIPSELSLDRLEKFLRGNQPCNAEQVSCNENLCQIGYNGVITTSSLTTIMKTQVFIIVILPGRPQTME